MDVVYTFKFAANMGEGTYSMAIALHTPDTHISKNFEWRDFALVFSIVNSNKDVFTGVNWLPPSLELTL